eukprot:scaffold11902_cov63-Phaeocystis_antarctica.AAC.2
MSDSCRVTARVLGLGQDFARVGFARFQVTCGSTSTPLGLPSNVSGTSTLGLYQPRALCAVAPHLLPAG